MGRKRQAIKSAGTACLCVVLAMGGCQETADSTKTEGQVTSQPSRVHMWLECRIVSALEPSLCDFSAKWEDLHYEEPFMTKSHLTDADRMPALIGECPKIQTMNAVIVGTIVNASLEPAREGVTFLSYLTLKTTKIGEGYWCELYDEDGTRLASRQVRIPESFLISALVREMISRYAHSRLAYWRDRATALGGLDGLYCALRTEELVCWKKRYAQSDLNDALRRAVAAPALSARARYQFLLDNERVPPPMAAVAAQALAKLGDTASVPRMLGLYDAHAEGKSEAQKQLLLVIEDALTKLPKEEVAPVLIREMLPGAEPRNKLIAKVLTKRYGVTQPDQSSWQRWWRERQESKATTD